MKYEDVMWEIQFTKNVDVVSKQRTVWIPDDTTQVVLDRWPFLKSLMLV